MLCDEMTSRIRAFWWGQSNGKNKMAWLSGDKVCTPKKMGGLGCCHLKSFNLHSSPNKDGNYKPTPTL